MKKKFWVSSLIVSGVGLATILMLPQIQKQQLKADLDLLCSAHEKAEMKMKEKSLSRLDAELTSQMWAEIDAGLKHPDMIKAVRAVAHASSEMKYSLYQQAAEEIGQPQWVCPAIERLNSL